MVECRQDAQSNPNIEDEISLSSSSWSLSSTTSSNVSEIVDELECNTDIDNVSLHGEHLNGLSRPDQQELLCTVGKLSSLRRVRFSGCRLRVRSLADFVFDARQLNVLEMDQVEFVGKQEDFEELYSHLFKHSCLQEFVLKDFAVAESSNLLVLDRLVQVLGLIPSLRVVRLRAKRGDNKNAYVDGLSFTGLVKRSKESLRELHLEGFYLDDHTVQRIARAAASETSRLRILSLVRVRLHDAAARQLTAAFLEQKRSGALSSLEELDLSDNVIGDDGCIALAKIGLNTGLQTLRLSGNGNIRRAGITALDAAQQQNKALMVVGLPELSTRDDPNKYNTLVRNRRVHKHVAIAA